MFSQSFPHLHGRTINVRNNNGETRNGEGLEPRLMYIHTCDTRAVIHVYVFKASTAARFEVGKSQG